MRPESLLDAVTGAETAGRRLLTDRRARSLLERICQLAREHGCRSVTGVSPVGHQVVGALLLHANGEFRAFEPLTEDNVLVLDAGVVATCGVALVMSQVANLTRGRVVGAALVVEDVPVPAELDLGPLIQLVILDGKDERVYAA